ncbi:MULTISPECIES: 4'-phosphopantetheinyl transferase family protein [unclassified Enterobacter]|uniref:4'-phosphopantetheinyl transferase family protein n=1 Tax=unclassified Enterobacter TaxID=2608935 RepID=UPI0003ED102D|nr:MULTISPECIES: 4'-phosphopantetheinyl transferase superfamily protein [unclassified Enterobacter]EWG64924.1 4'-phosphopantetheinyl transferase EntD [Enterobacter sp. DC3]EWG74977.1 4'-phosphopantetheinyl transferase EntD [Enterobacter sp. DC4]
MFTAINTDSAPPFIHSVEMGNVAPFPALRYCLVSFTVHEYHDGLFDKWGIPFPVPLNSAVVKRRAEYLAARYAAQRVLRSFGCDTTPGSAPDRSPVWPSGWRGSLSHSHEWALAVIAPEASGLTPGVDIEFFAPGMMQRTAHLFTTPQERECLAASPFDEASALLITFSAKESLYKALYPEVGRALDFDAARVCLIAPEQQRITLELTQTLSPQRVKGSRIQGYYQLSGDRVITIIA